MGNRRFRKGTSKLYKSVVKLGRMGRNEEEVNTLKMEPTGLRSVAMHCADSRKKQL